MAKDFRASQVQTNKLIASGSTSTWARILMYPIEKQDASSPNQGVIDTSKFSTSGIGRDIFFFVSGAIGDRNTTNGTITAYGGDVHISGNLTVDGTAPGTNLFRMTVVDFVSTEQTSSSPVVAGQVAFPANEFTGSITLRTILANTEAGGVAAIKFFNLDSLSFVEIGGPGKTELSVTGTTPTLVESVNLISASGFNSSSLALYELQLYSSTGSNTAQAGGGELRPSGSFTSLTIITSSVTNVFTSGTWVDIGNELYTTASVTIGRAGPNTFAGNDISLYVTGNVVFGNGSIITSMPDAAIISSVNSTISGTEASATSGSVIIGGGDHVMVDPDQFGHTNNAIIGGVANKSTASLESGIFVGSNNNLNEPINGAIVAGQDNTLGGSNQVIAGSSGVTTQGSIGFVAAHVGGNITVNRSVVLAASGTQGRLSNQSFVAAGNNTNIQRGNRVFAVGSDHFVSGTGNQSTVYPNDVVLIGSNNSILATAERNKIILVGWGLSGSNEDSHIIIGGDSSVSASYATRVVISASRGTEIKEGPLRAYDGLSGSLTKLTDGSSYLLAGANITLTTGSTGQVTIASTGGGGGGSGTTRLNLGSYSSTTATSSNPETVGGGYFVPSEHGSGSCNFRAILSVTTGSDVGFVQLYNTTSGALVHIGGASITELSTSNSTPTLLQSVDLLAATNFDSANPAIYEVRIYKSGSIDGRTFLTNSELVCT